MGEVTSKTWTDHSEPRIMAADLEAIEAAIVEAAASTIVGAGRPDIPATLTTPGTAALVAAATSGTVYRSTDGPQGAWEWQKRGSSWEPTQGDTGWIDISHLFTLPFELCDIWIRRINFTTYLNINSWRLTEPQPASTEVAMIPQRFRVEEHSWRLAPGFEGGRLSLRTTGALNTADPLPAGSQLRGTYSWPTQRSVWPNTLTL